MHFGMQTSLMLEYPTVCKYFPRVLSIRAIRRLHDTAGCRTAVRSTGCQTGLYNRFDNRLHTRYSRLSKRSDNLDNRLYRVNGALQTMNDSKSMIMHMHEALKRQSFAVSLDLHNVSEGFSIKF